MSAPVQFTARLAISRRTNLIKDQQQHWTLTNKLLLKTVMHEAHSLGYSSTYQSNCKDACEPG